MCRYYQHTKVAMVHLASADQLSVKNPLTVLADDGTTCFLYREVMFNRKSAQVKINYS